MLLEHSCVVLNRDDEDSKSWQEIMDGKQVMLSSQWFVTKMKKRQCCFQFLNIKLANPYRNLE